MKPTLNELEQKITETRQRNLQGSLEQAKEELRDAYMNYKDLHQRCVIDLKKKSNQDTTVLYFQPETFLLEEPEKQKIFRDQLLKKIGQVSKPEPITYLGDELHKSMCQSVSDQSQPLKVKSILSAYFQRRTYQLQHLKYKLLCRWAHYSLTSETIDLNTSDATFLFGKLEFSIDQTISRCDRLIKQDYFESGNSESRPSTKSENKDVGTMFVENMEAPAQSFIREDDIEVFLRGTTYRNKVNKTQNKFISRLKWLGQTKKYKIFEAAIEQHFKIKNENINRQKQIFERVKLTKSDQEISYYIQQYESMFLNEIDLLMYRWKANHDEVPKLFQDNRLLKIKVTDIAKDFNLSGDIEVDAGFTFSYQVTIFFPPYFQKQLIKSQFSAYDAFAGDLDPNEVAKRSLYQQAFIDSNIFRDVSTLKQSVPSDEALRVEFKDIDIKVMRLKSSSNWIDYICVKDEEPEWHQKQKAVLNCDNHIDTLLKSAFDFLDVNDIANVNRVNEDNAHMHIQTIQNLLKNNPHEQSKRIVVHTPDGDKPLNVDNLPNTNSTNLSQQIETHLFQAATGITEVKTGTKQKSTIQNHMLTAYYTLRYMKSRDAKTKVLYCLNYFRAIQRRIALDL